MDNREKREGVPERPDPAPERMRTAEDRQAPDFNIIGTQRGGTTSLFHYLAEHPSIGRSLRKEVHFFDRYYDKGMRWYLAHFPLRGEYPVVGEASPYYLFHPDTPQRIQAALPNTKFIALLRNPIDRAYSQHQMMTRRGIETLPFEEALAAENERLSRSDNPLSLLWRHHSYIRRGLYVDQLQRWYDIFPREQIQVIKSEDFYAEPTRILHELCTWLGVVPWAPDNLKQYNQSNYSDMNPDTRQALAEGFAPYNQRLYELIGRDFGWTA
jgi:hypothetical protein